jgi:hypothetical protein
VEMREMMVEARSTSLRRCMMIPWGVLKSLPFPEATQFYNAGTVGCEPPFMLWFPIEGPDRSGGEKVQRSFGSRAGRACLRMTTPDG